jgi:hypothetical protein
VALTVTTFCSLLMVGKNQAFTLRQEKKKENIEIEGREKVKYDKHTQNAHEENVICIRNLKINCEVFIRVTL